MARHLFLFALIFLIQFTVIEAKESPAIIEGRLDLSQWDFQTEGPVNLSGKWGFYWEQFISPDIHDLEKTTSGKTFIFVPGSWNQGEKGGKIFPGIGYGSYHLKIVLPARHAPLAMKIKLISSAYKIYVNGREEGSDGIVGNNAMSSSPGNKPQIIDLWDKANALDILIQVSNFHTAKGGILQNLQFGTQTQILKLEKDNSAMEFFLLGAIFMMGLYHLGLFGIRRKNQSALFFGIFCLLMALRILVVGELNIRFLFPDISWKLITKLDYLTYYSGIPVFGLYVHSLYRRDYRRSVLDVFQFTGALFSLIVVFMPVLTFSRTLIYYQIITLLFCAHLLYVITLAFVKRREGSGIFLVGLLLLFATVINDILFANGTIVTPYLVSFGFFLFLFIQSFILSTRLSKAFLETEKLSHENERLYHDINEYNQTLEAKVNERTKKLLEANATKDKFFSIISHDLRGPIGNISVILNDIFQAGEPAKEKLLTAIQQSSKDTCSLLEDLLNWSKSQKGQLKVNPVIFDIKQLIEESKSLFLSSATVKGVNLTMEVSDVSHKVLADRSMVTTVLRNLLNNAIKFCSQNDFISISVHESLEILTINVHDSGIGLTRNQIEKLFLIGQDDVLRRGTNNEKGSGLGLILCKDFVEANNGQIGVKSEQGKGSTFWFSLPSSKTSGSISPGRQG